MECATSTPSALGLPSFDKSARCEPIVARELAPRACGGRRPPACGGESSVAPLRYRRSERTELYIETQEGDVVRLRIKVSSALAAKVGHGDGELALDEMRVNARSAVRIRFSVEGDLNAEELAAIRSVVEQAGALAEELFAGDAPAAFATAVALEIDGAQLARLGLRLSVHEHLTYAALGRHRPAPAALPARGPEQPEPAPAPSEPATAEPGATTPAPASAAPAIPSANAVDATDGPAEPAVAEPAPVPARGSTSDVLDTIAKFVAHLLDSLAEPPPVADADALSIGLSLKLRVFKSVVLTLAAAQVPAHEEKASGVPLLAETLDALAAHEEPFDARA